MIESATIEQLKSEIKRFEKRLDRSKNDHLVRNAQKKLKMLKAELSKR